jgi:hypothetical protein
MKMIKSITNTIIGVTAGVLLGTILSTYLPLNNYDNPELFTLKGKYKAKCELKGIVGEVSVWEGDKGGVHYVHLKDRTLIELGNNCVLYRVGVF